MMERTTRCGGVSEDGGAGRHRKNRGRPTKIASTNRVGPLSVMAAGLLLVVCASLYAATVGTYLYTDPTHLSASYPGKLTVRFTQPGERLVLAYGRRYRKDRHSRAATTEAQRALFKPFIAAIHDNGRRAVWDNLPPDFYDIVVIDVQHMQLWEGLQLLHGSSDLPHDDPRFAGVRDSLSVRSDRVGGWEAFFDTKRFERFAEAAGRGAVFVQQMRLGTSHAESGAKLKGCVHSIDICWVAEAARGAGWQVIMRQQLYRGELPSRQFFRHAHLPELSGLRVGRRPREIGPVQLPPPPEK